MSLIYRNLDIELQARATGYRAKIEFQGVSELVDFTLDILPNEIETILVHEASKEVVKAFGQKLFDAIFDGEGIAHLRRGQEAAEPNNIALRIRLILNQAPALVPLPWEYLYDKKRARFLALSSDSPIVRTLETPEPLVSGNKEKEKNNITLPLKMLVVIANPTDGPRLLDSDVELKNLKTALKPLIDRNKITVEQLSPPTCDELEKALQNQTYHIIHFIGHGGLDEADKKGALLLETTEGTMDRVDGERLGAIFYDFRHHLRFVLLNICEGARSAEADPFTGIAQSLIQQGITAVIAMQAKVLEQDAVRFATKFYEALSREVPVETALTVARRSLDNKTDAVVWGLPVLYSRIEEGHIFQIHHDAPKTELADTLKPEPTWREKFQEWLPWLIALGAIFFSVIVLFAVWFSIGNEPVKIITETPIPVRIRTDPIRVQFQSGAVTERLTARINKTTIQRYLLWMRVGQWFHIDAQPDIIAVNLISPNQEILIDNHNRQFLQLPVSGDYILEVTTTKPTVYSLTVTIENQFENIAPLLDPPLRQTP